MHKERPHVTEVFLAEWRGSSADNYDYDGRRKGL